MLMICGNYLFPPTHTECLLGVVVVVVVVELCPSWSFFFQPRMYRNSFGNNAQPRLGLEYSTNQVFVGHGKFLGRFGTQLPGACQLQLDHHGCLVVEFERKDVVGGDEQAHAQRPNVRLEWIVRLSLQQLGRKVRHRAAVASAQGRILRELDREAKVG